jgi:hypothetical protein
VFERMMSLLMIYHLILMMMIIKKNRKKTHLKRQPIRKKLNLILISQLHFIIYLKKKIKKNKIQLKKKIKKIKGLSKKIKY